MINYCKFRCIFLKCFLFFLMLLSTSQGMPSVKRYVGVRCPSCPKDCPSALVNPAWSFDTEDAKRVYRLTGSQSELPIPRPTMQTPTQSQTSVIQKIQPNFHYLANNNGDVLLKSDIFGENPKMDSIQRIDQSPNPNPNLYRHFRSYKKSELMGDDDSSEELPDSNENVYVVYRADAFHNDDSPKDSALIKRKSAKFVEARPISDRELEEIVHRAIARERQFHERRESLFRQNRQFHGYQKNLQQQEQLENNAAPLRSDNSDCTSMVIPDINKDDIEVDNSGQWQYKEYSDVMSQLEEKFPEEFTPSGQIPDETNPVETQIDSSDVAQSQNANANVVKDQSQLVASDASENQNGKVDNSYNQDTIHEFTETPKQEASVLENPNSKIDFVSATAAENNFGQFLLNNLPKNYFTYS